MGLFSRKPKLPVPFEPSTGHAGDDQLLGIIATVPGGVVEPREWLHYVYCDTAQGATELERLAAAEGWTVSRVAAGEGIVAVRSDQAVSAQNVRAARAFFEAAAASVPGGEYDGWEAATG